MEAEKNRQIAFVTSDLLQILVINVDYQLIIKYM